MVEKEKREFAGWWFWILMLLVITSIIFAGLKYMGVIGGTVVERVTFENSFQYSEAVKAQIANDEAVIAEIEGKLLNPNLDENTRYNLNAQVSAARVRISTARSKQR